MKILADASLPLLPKAFPKPFELSFYHKAEEIADLLQGQQILICRSTLKVNEALLKNNRSLLYLATASSGTDHIDKNFLQDKGIALIDAKGSNARSVADYVLSSLAYLRKIHQIYAKKAIVVGVGKVGTQVIKRLAAVGMTVQGYDPLRVDYPSCALEEFFKADLIAIHANLQNDTPFPSQNLFNKELLTELKNKTVIINASRGGIVNEEDLLSNSNSLVYCTDVYQNEPSINPDIINRATLCTPHIAGHSVEAKNLAIIMISQELHRKLNLTPPQFEIPRIKNKLLIENSGWENLLLSLYNPGEETQRLKENPGSDTFLSLRKAHQQRHDFNSYQLENHYSEYSKILDTI